MGDCAAICHLKRDLYLREWHSFGANTRFKGTSLMLDKLFDVGAKILRFTGDFDKKTWLIVAAVGLCAGYFLLRGFGSRTNY